VSRTRFPAISYSRFSALIQAKGDSESRQERMFRDFCQFHNLTPLPEIFADRGRSGYKDEHRKKGRLGQLIAMAKDGRFDPGTVIVVEAWDRLGRLRPDRQTELVAELLRTGVRIGVCRLNDIFTEEDFGTHKWTTLAVFIQLAFQESKQKAERVAASWEQRRKRARERGELLTTRLPAWLECVRDEVRLVPERAAVVRRIFQMAADGCGYTKIVKTLDAEGVPAFGKVVINEHRSRSQFSGKWAQPYVRLILTDRRAVGEFQPHKIDGTPDGAPLAGYYPAAVTEEEFLLAKAGQEQRSNRDRNGHRTGPRQSKYVNVFKSLLRHARDGEGFMLQNSGTAEVPLLILVNAKGKGGRGRCYTFPYAILEEAILRMLREVKPDDVLPPGNEQPSKITALRAKLAHVRQDMARIQEDLKGGYSKGLASVLRDHEAAEEQVAAELQEELVKSAKPAARAMEELPSLVDMIRGAADPDDVRLKVRVALRRVVEEAWVLMVRRGSYTLCFVQVFFPGGRTRDYLVVNQAAGFRRKGGSWARAYPEAARLGAFDLRRQRDATRLEKVLAAIPLSAVAE
jgi:DNA invertase Pin-like site-specific DNA recombinase